MSQTWVIAEREYLQRIRSKAFILATALGPIVLLVMFAIPVITGMLTSDDTERTIAVVDESGEFLPFLRFPSNIDVRNADVPLDTLRAQLRRDELQGYLVLPTDLAEGGGEARFYSAGGGGLMFTESISDVVRTAVREYRVIDSGAPAEVLEIMNASVPVRMIEVTDEGERSDSTLVLAMLGYFMGFLIYICVLLYGAIVMRGVIEEKTNRISELIASSARPFDLMMGKVLGIGAMGATQWIIWIGAAIALSIAAASLVPSILPDASALGGAAAAAEGVPMDPISQFIPEFSLMLPVYFLLFFLGGYLLYSSLMAAVGSAVEQEQDAQQFMWIVVMPLIVPMIMIVNVMADPNGAVATVMSLIPFFSPVIMVVRMAATTVPWWQIWLSLALLAGTFMVAIWVSARIYRVGILSYGKKPTFAEIARWVRQA